MDGACYWACDDQCSSTQVPTGAVRRHRRGRPARRVGIVRVRARGRQRQRVDTGGTPVAGRGLQLIRSNQ
ncbi:hypothetical protein GUJ93_ZPchr0002g26554 [Zizania palustris]|uniref:Uncharacterized protein n=1 Tax=Zizania palustris TaxID=103762 RepID=A0A8J5S3M8_ZIZPA|nr:hypothetical protein GUJ93_ZPchr0002g26554 [Zizania palustris]